MLEEVLEGVQLGRIVNGRTVLKQGHDATIEVARLVDYQLAKVDGREERKQEVRREREKAVGQASKNTRCRDDAKLQITRLHSR